MLIIVICIELVHNFLQRFILCLKDNCVFWFVFICSKSYCYTLIHHYRLYILI